MAMARPMTAARTPAPVAPADPGDNGYERYATRLVGGLPRRVVVERGFTVQGLPTEQFDVERFTFRMQHFAGTLEEQMRHEVTSLKIHRRIGKAPWAEFDVRTPEYYLPIPIRPTDQ